MLSSRFQTHVKLKVKPCQQSNRCLPWANTNLALDASWMIVALHVKEEISCLDESKCLQTNTSNNRFLVCLNKELSHLGWYLHYNQNKDIWNQSGIATGEGGFRKRLKTHLERAWSDRNNDDSYFYHFYPLKSSERANYFLKEGYFGTWLCTLGKAFRWNVLWDAFLSQVGCWCSQRRSKSGLVIWIFVERRAIIRTCRWLLTFLSLDTS